MRSRPIGKKMLAALCIAILAISIALFAISPMEIIGCATYCRSQYKEEFLFNACFDGCIAYYNQ